MLPPLLLTGGPAVGKRSTAMLLVEPLRRAAVIDPENACDLARRYLHWSIEVVLSDVLDHETASLYRRLLPGVLILPLRLPLAEARRRATLRPVYLTDDEFEALHALQRDMAGPRR